MTTTASRAGRPDASPRACREWWIPASLLALTFVPSAAGASRLVDLSSGRTAENARFFERGGIYSDPSGDAYEDNWLRFAAFARAALLIAAEDGADVVHCHDWQAALLPVYRATGAELGLRYPFTTVLTIHNLAYQGNFPASTWPAGSTGLTMNRPLDIAYGFPGKRPSDVPVGWSPLSPPAGGPSAVPCQTHGAITSCAAANKGARRFAPGGGRIDAVRGYSKGFAGVPAGLP